MKRMGGLLATYEEKKADLRPEEKADRLHIIILLKESVKLLRHDYEQQTKQFEMGGYRGDNYYENNWGANEATMVTDTSNVGFSLNNDRAKMNSPNDNILLN